MLPPSQPDKNQANDAIASQTDSSSIDRSGGTQSEHVKVYSFGRDQHLKKQRSAKELKLRRFPITPLQIGQE